MALDVDRCSYEPYVIIPRQGKSYLEEGGEGNNEKDLMKRKSCYQETGAHSILIRMNFRKSSKGGGDSEVSSSKCVLF